MSNSNKFQIKIFNIYIQRRNINTIIKTTWHFMKNTFEKHMMILQKKAYFITFKSLCLIKMV